MATLTIRPDDAGDLTQISEQVPALGEHWDKCDEAVADDGTTQVRDATPSADQTDLYNLQHTSQAGVIDQIQVFVRFYYFYIAGNDIRIRIKTEGTIYEFTLSKSAGWYTYSQVLANNPKTSSAWTWTQINALQAGGRLIQAATGTTLAITQVYVVVTYHIAAPTVTTQAATNVEETTATGNGNITDTGGQKADQRGFEWGTSPGTYPNSVVEGTPDSYVYDTGAYSLSLTDLPQGTKIYYRAKAHNSAGWGYGAEQTFLTKPEAPTSLNAVTKTSTQINLTWTKGTGASKTMVRGKAGSYPTNKTDGTQVYFDTGTSCSDTDLSPSTLYYYRAWSYASANSLEQYSDNYSQDYDLTKPEAPTGLTATIIWSTSLRLSWTKGTGANRTMVRRKEGGYPVDRTDGTQEYYGTGTTFDDTGLVKGTPYYYRAWSEITAGSIQRWSDGYAQVTETPNATTPSCHTRRAIALTGTTAILAGDVTFDGLAECDVRFQWGLTTSYGNNTPWQSGKLTSDVITQAISGLTLGSVYHFRMQIKNQIGTTIYSSASDDYHSKSDPDYYTAWTATSAPVVGGVDIDIGQHFDGELYMIFRAGFFFDTSSIPSDAEKNSAKLCLMPEMGSPTGILVVVQNGQPTYPHDPMVAGDYNKAHYSGDGGSGMGTEELVYFDIVFNETGRGWIQQGAGAKTKLWVRSYDDIWGFSGDAYEYYAVCCYESGDPSWRPKLVVTYTVPEDSGADEYFLSVEPAKTKAILGLACLGVFALGRKGEIILLAPVRQQAPPRVQSAVRTLAASREMEHWRWG